MSARFPNGRLSRNLPGHMKYLLFPTSVVALCLLAIPVVGFAADWPCYLGPTHDNIAPDTGLNKDWAAKPPKTLWTAPLSDKGHAGAAVADGKVFIVDHQAQNDIVRAIDFSTGANVWSYTYPETTQNRFGFTECTPLVADGKVYTFSRLGRTVCLSADKGDLVWSRDACADFAGRRPEWDYASSPAIIDGKLILFPGGTTSAVVALDPQTGKTLWQIDGSKPGYATPVHATLNGQSQILAFIAEGLISLDPATGRRLWAFPWTVNYDQNTATPIVRDDTIFFTTAFKKGSVMLDLTGNQPKPIWKSLEMQSRFPNPVIHSGRIYGMQDPGKLVCLDTASGKLLWSRPGFEYPSTIAADGCIFVLEGKSGDLILLDAQAPEYKELGRIRPAPGPNCWAPPIISNGRLLVRNETSLVCVDLR